MVNFCVRPSAVETSGSPDTELAPLAAQSDNDRSRKVYIYIYIYIYIYETSWAPQTYQIPDDEDRDGSRNVGFYTAT
jgi:hypothetical protein